MSLFKLAKTVELNIRHIKQDGKEFNEVQALAKAIVAKVNKMKQDDNAVLKNEPS